MEAIKKLLRTPSALALIIVAIITLIGVIIQTNSSKAVLKLSIDATSTAEAKQTPNVQPLVVTQIVTQLVEVSPTPSPPFVALFDDFAESRNDGMGLQLIDKEKLVTTISGGHYLAQINSPNFVQFVDLVTPNKIRDFDFSLKIAEITGEVYLSIRFRDISGQSNSSLVIFAKGPRKGEYLIYDGVSSESIVRANISYNDLTKIHIICIDSRCDFFINDSTAPIQTVNSIFDPSGKFKIGFSGNGEIRIDEVKIQELK